MIHRKLRNSDWQGVVERFEKKLGNCKGKLLSSGGRLVLINSVLSNLPIFMMSFFEIPTGILEKLDFIRSRFYWQGGNHKKKYRLTKWNIVCQPKYLGSLGVVNLAVKNCCLLSKWLYKLLTEDGIWQQILTNKYLGSKSLTQVSQKPDDSHFWSSLMKVKDEFLGLGTFEVGAGNQTRFWEDIWTNNKPLKEQFPSLYNIVRRKNSLVSDVIRSSHLNLSFRRPIVGVKFTEWQLMMAQLSMVRLGDEHDKFKWGAHKTGVFSVWSMYALLMNTPNINHNVWLWKLKLPLKIKSSFGI